MSKYIRQIQQRQQQQTQRMIQRQRAQQTSGWTRQQQARGQPSSIRPGGGEARAAAPTIFISYRRQDSADVSGRIYEHLVARYGKAAVFMDVDAIPYGEDFAQFIQDELRKCSIVLVVIGPGWLKAATPEDQRRLDDPGDFVHIEVETALEQGLPVVPLLVSAAHARPNPDFTTDMKRLCDTIDRYMPQPLPSPLIPVLPTVTKPSPCAVRRRMITILAIVGVVLLTCAGGVYGAIKLQQALFKPDPVEVAVTAFCNSLNSGDIDTAYSDLSSSFQARATKDTFLTPPDGIGERSCIAPSLLAATEAVSIRMSISAPG